MLSETIVEADVPERGCSEKKDKDEEAGIIPVRGGTGKADSTFAGDGGGDADESVQIQSPQEVLDANLDEDNFPDGGLRAWLKERVGEVGGLLQSVSGDKGVSR